MTDAKIKLVEAIDLFMMALGFVFRTKVKRRTLHALIDQYYDDME